MQTKTSRNIFFPHQEYQNNNQSSWEVVYSGEKHTLFFNASTGTILGYGKNHSLVSKYKLGSEKLFWSIPTREGCKIKQVAGGDNHILILYENGLLDGYGRGSSGQLGIGCFDNRELNTVSIFLPDNGTIVYIA